MAILNFSDVLKNVGLDPKRVKLIRHSLGDKAFKKCYDKNMVEEYTRVQSETFSNGYDYWCVFISDKSTTAKFFACYKVNGGVIDTQDTKPKGFPLEDWFQGQRMFYNLERIDLLKECEGRLLIEWGKSALAWAQKGTNEKPIVAIRDKKIFSGYENAILTYEELREIVQDPTAYESWHTALSTINAVYLIVDRENGRRYRACLRNRCNTARPVPRPRRHRRGPPQSLQGAKAPYIWPASFCNTSRQSCSHGFQRLSPVPLDGAAGHSHHRADLAVRQFQDTMQYQDALSRLGQAGKGSGHQPVADLKLTAIGRKYKTVAGVLIYRA